MKSVTFGRNHPVPTLPIGTKVICEEKQEFIDGTVHLPNQVFIVSEENQAYFSIFVHNEAGYRLVID